MLRLFSRKKIRKKMSYIENYSFINESKRTFGFDNNSHSLSDKEIVENDFLTSIYRNQNYNYSKFFKMDFLAKNVFLLAENLKNFLPENRNNVGIVFMNNFASFEADVKFEKTISDKNNYFPSPSIFVYTLPNISTGEVCIRHGLKGESSFYVLEKFSPEIFVNIVNSSLIFQDYVLSGWSEFVNSQIKSMMFLVSKFPKKENCEKFDAFNVKKIFETIWKN